MSQFQMTLTCGFCWKAATLDSDLFAVSGSAAVYDSSPLQRLLRDVHVAGQHLLNRPRTVDAVGTALVG
ncbi:hypothetical protein [Pseudonocardia sp. NPDC049635]|uniref:hypothetical protein n=1 Tax=Pseudonocardia sp. NPDC049635 TaxID=3155506 RepID=UPI00340231D1